jgi:outer membrane receptor protein involved in Fe transport
LDSLTTSFTGNYSQGYETAVATGGYTDVSDLIEICSECESNNALVPTYLKTKIESRFLVNMSLNWELEIYGANALNLNVNISNLFDSRTYAVSPISNGIETGRQFWLGINYAFN